MLRINFAGFPANMPGLLMSLVTTDPAPITTLSQILTGKIVALLPMETLLPITVCFHKELLPPAGRPVLNRSFINTTPCPIKQSHFTVTSSQIKVCYSGSSFDLRSEHFFVFLERDRQNSYFQ